MADSTDFGKRSRARRRWLAPGLIAVVLIFGAGGAAAVDSTPSDFRAVVPLRVFDTRTGLGGVAAAPLGPGASLDVVFGGSTGIATDAKGVSLNVTVVGGTASSYLTIWPTGDPRPFASSLNWTGPDATPNAVTVGLGPGGRVSFYNDAGTVHLFADVVGYYTATSAGQPGPAGPIGPQGPAGLTGPQGPAGLAASGGLQEYRTSATWTAPAGVRNVEVEAWGAGGGGGTAASTPCTLTSGDPGGGGGGGGSYVRTIVPVMEGTTYEVTVGAGGAPEASGTASRLGKPAETPLMSAGGGFPGASAALGSAGGAGGIAQSTATGILRSGRSGGSGFICSGGQGGFPVGMNDINDQPGVGGGGGRGTPPSGQLQPPQPGRDGYIVMTW